MLGEVSFLNHVARNMHITFNRATENFDVRTDSLTLESRQYTESVFYLTVPRTVRIWKGGGVFLEVRCVSFLSTKLLRKKKLADI
jgi:hypothetical protein